MTRKEQEEQLAVRVALDELRDVEKIYVGDSAPLGDDGVTYETFVKLGQAPVTDLTGQPISNEGDDSTWAPTQGSR